MSLNERSFIQHSTAAIVARLKDLGVVVPEMPEGDGNVFEDCEKCRGSGNIKKEGKDVTEICLCPTCGGSGQTVRNDLFEWKQKILRLQHKHLAGR